MQVAALQQCQLARPTDSGYSLNGIADTIQKEFRAKFSVRLLHLVESASSRAGEVTLWLEVNFNGTRLQLIIFTEVW